MASPCWGCSCSSSPGPIEPILPLRLFQAKVFSDCCALAFIVGFTMLGAMTFLPSFFQYVEGVTATQSGFRMLPLVLGLLITAITSGNIVSKTGRYKIFPVAGGLVMALGLFLLSTMDPSTPAAVSAFYLFVLGMGIGLSMQVLTIIVQSSVPYGDLGVATSGVTFFRTMGSAFGAAIFGTLYANFLSDRLPDRDRREPRGHPGRPRDAERPARPRRTASSRPIVNAYSEALTQVFLWAVPVALIAFVLALFLPQVKLGDSLTPSASDLGGGFGAPESLSNDEVLGRRIANLLYGQRRDLVLDLLGEDTDGLDAARIWALVQVHGLTIADRKADVTQIAHARALPSAVLEPVFADLIVDGYAEGSLHDLGLTPAGHAAIAALRVQAARLDHRAPRRRRDRPRGRVGGDQPRRTSPRDRAGRQQAAAAGPAALGRGLGASPKAGDPGHQDPRGPGPEGAPPQPGAVRQVVERAARRTPRGPAPPASRGGRAGPTPSPRRRPAGPGGTPAQRRLPPATSAAAPGASPDAGSTTVTSAVSAVARRPRSAVSGRVRPSRIRTSAAQPRATGSDQRRCASRASAPTAGTGDSTAGAIQSPCRSASQAPPVP